VLAVRDAADPGPADAARAPDLLGADIHLDLVAVAGGLGVGRLP
jgi:hypothetical protein